MAVTRRVWIDTVKSLGEVHGEKKFVPDQMLDLADLIDAVENYYLHNGDLIGEE